MKVKSPKVEPRHLCSAIKGRELEGQHAALGKLLRKLDSTTAKCRCMTRVILGRSQRVPYDR